MHTPTKPRYRAFLMRLWEGDALKPPAEAWRFSLEDPHSGQKRGFASLASAQAAAAQAAADLAPGILPPCEWSARGAQGFLGNSPFRRIFGIATSDGWKIASQHGTSGPSGRTRT